MKKLLLMTVALLALGAAVAAAQDGTMNLSWGNVCRTTANNGTAATNDVPNNVAGTRCDDVSDPFSGATRILTMSFKNNQTHPTFGGCAVVLEMIADADRDPSNNPIPAAFWSFETGHQGGIVNRALVPSVVTNCSSPWALAPADGQTSLPSLVEAQDANGRVRFHYKNSRARNTTVTPLGTAVGTGGWVADQAVLDLSGGGGDPAPTYEGCEVPVCFNLNSVQYGGGTLLLTINQPELRNWISWAGGTADCPGATPTKNATWGSVKALYR